MMDLYNTVSMSMAKLLTEEYSTSFSTASRLFPPVERRHIYAIYALVRIADEIVDTYDGGDKKQLLDDLELEVVRAVERGYSVNPIVQAFAVTANSFDIKSDLLGPFFDSMRMDITTRSYTAATLSEYIYGSAEVVGLMCLRVFCKGDEEQYQALALGAQRLGSAYQKVNFLRDIAADHNDLQRYYFTEGNFAEFNDPAKQRITDDIRKDFLAARPYIIALPREVQPAVRASYSYYEALLTKLEHTPAEEIKRRRIRLPAIRKVRLLAPHVARKLI